MFGNVKNIVGIVVAAMLFGLFSSTCNAQTYTSDNGYLTVNASIGLNNVASACIYGQIKITGGVPAGYCYVNTSKFKFGGNALATTFYLDKNLNLHTDMIVYGRYYGTVTTVAYGYITSTCYLDPTKQDTAGALLEGVIAPYTNKVLYSTGWTDENGNGPDSTDLIVEWPVLKGYFNVVPLTTPEIVAL